MNSIDGFVSIVLSILTVYGSPVTTGAAELSFVNHSNIQQCEKFVNTQYNEIHNIYENKGHKMQSKLNNSDGDRFFDHQSSVCVETVSPQNAGAIYTFGLVYDEKGYEQRSYSRKSIHLRDASKCTEIDTMMHQLNTTFTPPQYAILGNCVVL